MPIENVIDLKRRELKTLSRIRTAKRGADVLESFFQKGFKNYDAISAVVLNYYPEVSQSRLYDFWHFRMIDEDFCDMLEDVFEKLKIE